MAKVRKLGAIKFGFSMEDGEESGNAKAILDILSIKIVSKFISLTFFEELSGRVAPDCR